MKPVERSRADKRSTSHALVVTSSNDIRNKKKRCKEKEFEEWPAIPCTTEEMHAIIDKWIADGFLRLPSVSKEPMEDEKNHASFFCYHCYVHHPTSECFLTKKFSLKNSRWNSRRHANSTRCAKEPAAQPREGSSFCGHSCRNRWCRWRIRRLFEHKSSCYQNFAKKS